MRDEERTTVSTDGSAVLNVISEFLSRLEKGHGELTDDTPLYADGLGLDSVEAAELSAVLEDEFGTDPFSAGEVPDTVGEIVAFYGSPSSV
jgi:acyl carrier protein